MIMRKTGMPERDELVVCRITKLHPNSAFADIVEYNRTGMIHVSEVAKRWVRDIREFVKENQYVVCRVMKVEGDNILLSIKRVHREQANSKLNEFKRERKAEKMLELAGKEIGKDLEEAYEEVGYILQEEFGSISKAFEFALKDPEMLTKKGVPKEWKEPIVNIAERNYVEKVYEVKASLKLVSYLPNGAEAIKSALLKAQKGGLEAKYISAPKYLICGKGKNMKQLAEKVETAAKAVVKEIGGKDGSAEYNIVEE